MRRVPGAVMAFMAANRSRASQTDHCCIQPRFRNLSETYLSRTTVARWRTARSRRVNGLVSLRVPSVHPQSSAWCKCMPEYCGKSEDEISQRMRDPAAASSRCPHVDAHAADFAHEAMQRCPGVSSPP